MIRKKKWNYSLLQLMSMSCGLGKLELSKSVNKKTTLNIINKGVNLLYQVVFIERERGEIVLEIKNEIIIEKTLYLLYHHQFKLYNFYQE
jgi:hypothetical protein